MQSRFDTLQLSPLQQAGRAWPTSSRTRGCAARAELGAGESRSSRPTLALARMAPAPSPRLHAPLSLTISCLRSRNSPMVVRPGAPTRGRTETSRSTLDVAAELCATATSSRGTDPSRIVRTVEGFQFDVLMAALVLVVIARNRKGGTQRRRFALLAGSLEEHGPVRQRMEPKGHVENVAVVQ